MKVKDLISKLTKFNPEMEVVLFDGYNTVAYRGDWEIKEFEGTVDIGIGGTIVEDGEE